MAKYSEFLKELIGFVKKSKVPFSNGLLKTDSDAVVGYSAEMQNMVIENGIAVKRRGSFLLNDGDSPQKYYLLENIYIGASEFIIGVNHNRELIAHFSRFPEKTMKVYRNHFKRNKLVSFTRGVKFFIISTPSGYTILNEFGDAYSIKNNGVLRISQNDGTVSEFYYPTDEYSRDIGAEFRLYLDIVTSTNEELFDFYVSEDYAYDTIPLKGEIRCAYKNEAGVISKLSEPISLAEYKSVIVGLNPITSTRRDFKSANGTDIYQVVNHISAREAFNNSTQSYVRLESNIALNATTAITEYTNRDTPLPSNQSGDDTAISSFRIMINREHFIISPVYLDGDDETMNDVVVTMEALTAPNYNGRFKGKVYGYLDDPSGSVRDMMETDIIEYERQPNFTFGLNNSKVWTWTTKASAQNPATFVWYWNSFGTRNVAKTKSIDIDWTDVKLPSKAGYYWSVVDIFYYTVSKELVPMYPVINANTLTASSLFNHKGYDCWNRTDDEGIGKLTNTGYLSTNSGAVLPPYEYMEAENATEPNSVGTEDPYNARQIALWYDGYIISEAQKVLTYATDGVSDVIYGVNDDATTDKAVTLGGTENKRVVSQIPLSIVEQFMSFTKPIYQTLRKVARAYSPATELLHDVRDIASNGATLCAVRSNRLWLGSSLTLLLEKQLELSGYIYSVDSFMDGFVVFTSSGGYFLNVSGAFNRINGMTETTSSVVMSYNAISAVYGVDAMGRVVVVSQKEIFEGTVVKSYSIISQAINAHKFSSDTVMTEVDGVLYVGDGDTLYGYRDGMWITEQKFTQTISDVVYPKHIHMMTPLEDKLVISFYDYPSEETLDFSTEIDPVGM